MESEVADLRGSWARDIPVRKCEIVIVYGHAITEDPLRWHVEPGGCNAAGSVTCWADANNAKIVIGSGHTGAEFFLPAPINPAAADLDFDETNPQAIWDPARSQWWEDQLRNNPGRYFDGIEALKKMRQDAEERAREICKKNCCDLVWIRFVRSTTKPSDDDRIPFYGDIPIRCR